MCKQMSTKKLPKSRVRYVKTNLLFEPMPQIKFKFSILVCWPCHESCDTCAGGGQDSCLSCAPAHLYVVDLAVCLQVCPDGYYESK